MLVGWGSERNLAHIGEFAPKQDFVVEFLITAARPDVLESHSSTLSAFFLKPPRVRVNRYTEPLNFLSKLMCALFWFSRRRSSFDFVIVSNPEECIISFVAIKVLRLSSRLVVYSQIPVDLAPARSFLRLALRAYLAITRQSDGVWCLSQGLLDHLAETHGVRSQMSVLPSCIDHSQVTALSRARVEEGWLREDRRRTVVWVGRLSNRQKRLDVLLQAVALLGRDDGMCPFKVVVVGDGEDREALEELARSLGLEGQVYFLGYRGNPFPYYALADLFVLTSDIEGFGNVIVEAMSCGLPVVATDCRSGPAEILERGKWGVLVPTGDHLLLAGEIKRVLLDEELQLHLRQKSLARARDFECSKVFAGLNGTCDAIDLARETGEPSS